MQDESGPDPLGPTHIWIQQGFNRRDPRSSILGLIEFKFESSLFKEFPILKVS